MSENQAPQKLKLPFFGVRRIARQLAAERDAAKAQLERIAEMGSKLVVEVKVLRSELRKLGALPVVELEVRKQQLAIDVQKIEQIIEQKNLEAASILDGANKQLAQVRRAIVETEENAILQEVGVYKYRHPLTDAVAYEQQLNVLYETIKTMNMKDGGAVKAATGWTVNGSASEGRAMIRDFSKLMLRAFNAEADNLVRALKPYKLNAALDRLRKVAETIVRLGKTMDIRISQEYLATRVKELELTADFLQKEAEEKEAERRDRERLREERKVQQEIERERERLEKERQHHVNALNVLIAKGDAAGAERLKGDLASIDKNLQEVDYRAANVRAGYVYVISNIGSFGEGVIKVGMTRRLDPLDRIRELSDASVPFNFDVHAVHFSKDAVGIEHAMHERLSEVRLNLVNQRREFFLATPLEAKSHLASLMTGELLQFNETPEALEFRQCLRLRNNISNLAHT